MPLNASSSGKESIFATFTLYMTKFKFLLILLFITAFQFTYAQLSPKEINVLKMEVVKAVDDSHLTDSLYHKIVKLPGKNALLVGYMGTLQALKAKHSWNPYNKIKYVSLAIKTMKQAISLDPENMEIRFMRFSIEHFTPAFLGFSKDLEADRKEIVKHYQNHSFATADEALVKNVARFMVDSKRCTPDEIGVLNKYF